MKFDKKKVSKVAAHCFLAEKDVNVRLSAKCCKFIPQRLPFIRFSLSEIVLIKNDPNRTNLISIFPVFIGMKNDEIW